MVFVMCFSSSRFELKSTSATSRMSASVSRPVVSMSSPIAYSLVMFLLLSVCSLAFFPRVVFFEVRLVYICFCMKVTIVLYEGDFDGFCNEV